MKKNNKKKKFITFNKLENEMKNGEFMNRDIYIIYNL